MSLLSALWTVLSYLGPFVFVLGIVVFFHELGHFLVGRLCGVRVDAFSIGFGPEIFGFEDRWGTRWRLSVVPLGGYVKFHGDANGASVSDNKALATMGAAERASTFNGQPVWKRALIVFAGPAANFVLAIVIFSGVIFANGEAILRPVVAGVIPGQAAAAAGFKPGDLVEAVDGRPIKSWADLQDRIQQSAGVPLTVKVRRGDQQLSLVATPQMRTIHTMFGESRVALLGLDGSSNPADVSIQRLSLPASVALASHQTWFATSRTAEMVGQIFTGKQSADQISGPVGIAKLSGDVARLGFAALLNLAAILSISIGLINLAPVPLLDGGHLLYFAVESLIGHPMSERAQEYGYRLGLGLVLALMIFATFNDFIHLSRS